MKPLPSIDRAIYLAVVVLALVAILLSYIAPDRLVATQVIYQGF